MKVLILGNAGVDEISRSGEDNTKFSCDKMSKVMQAKLKVQEAPSLQNKWNKAFRARDYYVATKGNVTEDILPLEVGGCLIKHFLVGDKDMVIWIPS